MKKKEDTKENKNKAKELKEKKVSEPKAEKKEAKKESKAEAKKETKKEPKAKENKKEAKKETKKEIKEVKVVDYVGGNKVMELKKALFEHKQKLLQGELKDISVIRKTRREIARLLTAENAQKINKVKVEQENKVNA